MKPSWHLKPSGLGGNWPSGVCTHTIEATSVFVRVRHCKRTQSVLSPSVSAVTSLQSSTPKMWSGDDLNWITGWLNLLVNKQTATCTQLGVCAQFCSAGTSSLPPNAAFSAADAPSASALLLGKRNEIKLPALCLAPDGRLLPGRTSSLI